MRRMSPNQSGTVGNDDDGRTAVVVTTGSNANYRISNENDMIEGDDPMLATDCQPRESLRLQPQHQLHLPGMGIKDPRTTSFQSHSTRKEQTPNGNTNIGAVKGNSEEEDFEEEEDDRSSVVTESSQSEWEDQKEGCFNEKLRLEADSLAVDAINCASDELQGNKRGVICVNSDLNGARGVAAELSPREIIGSSVGRGRANNGYVMSEVGMPSRRRQRDAKMSNGKELALKGTNNQVAQSTSASQSQSLATINTPGAQTTTAIFNDSTDITVGNKTFITGSLTIKQYIKDSGPSNCK